MAKITITIEDMEGGSVRMANDCSPLATREAVLAALKGKA